MVCNFRALTDTLIVHDALRADLQEHRRRERQAIRRSRTPEEIEALRERNRRKRAKRAARRVAMGLAPKGKATKNTASTATPSDAKAERTVEDTTSSAEASAPTTVSKKKKDAAATSVSAR